MARKQYTLSDEIADTSFRRPHVVILGAGASIAATPQGDRSARWLPSMLNFVQVVGLKPILAQHAISYLDGENFELLYSRLGNDPSKTEVLAEIEEAVGGYFRSLSLPENVTVYDKLVLALRGKDLIATFNWDPFLYQACYRNRHVADLPHVVYLHGNVATAYCLKDRKKSVPGSHCSVCKERLTPSKLLFPIEHKNYTDSEFIDSEWQALKNYLKSAYMITIFGYGAPTSDVEAVSLMKEAWGDVDQRELEQTEILDIRDRDELEDLWSPFIHTHHCEVHDAFEKSWLANHPRRSCEATWQQFMEVQFLDNNPMPTGGRLADLRAWLKPLVAAEGIK